VTPRVRSIVLRAAGVLLVALGLLHLAATPFIVRMLQDGAAPEAAGWLTPPMVLNRIAAIIVCLASLALLVAAFLPRPRSEANG